MRARCVAPGFVAVMALTGCGHQPVAQRSSPAAEDAKGHWVLESYDTKRGYTFDKDGVRYEAHCTGYYLSADSGEEVYYSSPTVNIEEGTCSAVLPYLHKPVRLEQGLDTLYYRSDVSSRVRGRFVFAIIAAK